MPHFLLFIFAILGIYYIVTEKWSRKIFILIMLAAYLFIFSIFNANVREASWHGNTKHGWYSKYNSTEKLIATAWVLFFPVFTFIIYSFIFNSTSEKKTEHLNGIADKSTEGIKCPKCGNPMVLRKATIGKHIGKLFWGCSKYPGCKQIIEYTGTSEETDIR